CLSTVSSGVSIADVGSLGSGSKIKVIEAYDFEIGERRDPLYYSHAATLQVYFTESHTLSEESFR
ncbi:hypothetical protein OAQ84_01905, partial [Bdellovibrionales bacterium]|nr:hypothetical protein [Bdellovibrionales bacterium]